jgi:hypothetical protein
LDGISKRYKKFISKKARRRRHFLYVLLLAFLLFYSFLIVDLNSIRLITGEGTVGVFSLQKQENRAVFLLFGQPITVPQRLQNIVEKIKLGLTR